MCHSDTWSSSRRASPGLQRISGGDSPRAYTARSAMSRMPVLLLSFMVGAAGMAANLWTIYVTLECIWLLLLGRGLQINGVPQPARRLHE